MLIYPAIIIPSLLFLVSWFCTPLEVKFHVFGSSKPWGRKKSLLNIYFLLYLPVHCGDFIEQIKKSVLHFKDYLSCTYYC